MEALVAVLAVSPLVVFVLCTRETARQERAWREHVQRLERMLMAKDLADAAAYERVALPTDAGAVPNQTRDPDQMAEFWKSPVRARPPISEE